MSGLLFRLGARAIGEPAAVRPILPLYGAAEPAEVESLEAAESTTPSRRLTQAPPTVPASPGAPHDPPPIISRPEPPILLPLVQGSQPSAVRWPAAADQVGERRRDHSGSTDTAPDVAPDRRAQPPAVDLPNVAGAVVREVGLARDRDPQLSPPSRESWQQTDAAPMAPEQPGFSSALEELAPSTAVEGPAPPRSREPAETHELDVTVETLLPHAKAFDSPASFQERGMPLAFSRRPPRELSPEPSPTEVHVTIGRIEVTAVQESAIPPPRPRAERRREMTLEQYLAGRRREAR